MRLDPRIERALEETGLPWEVEPARRHQRIKLDGKLVGVVSRRVKGKGIGRHVDNVVSQVRQAARSEETARALP